MSLVEKAKEIIKTVYDPEIPVNIWDLGLIYKIEEKELDFGHRKEWGIYIEMTLTSPTCPLAQQIVYELSRKLDEAGIVNLIRVVFDPPWTPERMSEEARAKLGFF